MLLRSSSTPILGSLVPSFSESPQKLPTPNAVHHNCSKLPRNDGGFNNVARFLSHSPSVAETKGAHNGIRRVQSEGNLEELGGNTSDNVDDLTFSDRNSKKPGRQASLEPIPSFSHHNSGTCLQKHYDRNKEEDEEKLGGEGNFNPFLVQNLLSQKVRRNENGYGNVGVVQVEGKMYLATGIGVPAFGSVGHGGCGGGGGSYRPVDFNRDGGGSRGLSMEKHYKSMLEQGPGNPLFLGNYAHFLYQEKGDLKGAEEYYSRAILADPEDGEVLCQYAKLIWELHHDKERAAAYFERAFKASSEDSHINASYASFLWDTEVDEGEVSAAHNSPLLHHGIMASATS